MREEVVTPTVTIVGKGGPTVIAATDAATILMTHADFVTFTSAAPLTPLAAEPAMNPLTSASVIRS